MSCLSFLLWLYQGTACTFFLREQPHVPGCLERVSAGLSACLLPFLGPWLLTRLGAWLEGSILTRLRGNKQPQSQAWGLTGGETGHAGLAGEDRLPQG